MQFDWFDSTYHKLAQYKQKGFAPILILVGIAVLMTAVAAGAYYFGKFQVPKPQPQNPPDFYH